MTHYIFNLRDKAHADRLFRTKMWGIDADEPHRSALAAGDLVLLYLAAPERTFIGRAVVASAAHDWAPSESAVYPGDAPSGVLLDDVEEWRPALPMSEVLARIDKSEGARADFETGVVRITANEYETALSVRLIHARRL